MNAECSRIGQHASYKGIQNWIAYHRALNRRRGCAVVFARC